MAFEKMNADHRLVTLVNDHTVRTIARMMDWVAAHSWLAVAYFIAVVAFVTFLQIRGRPPWTHWLAALILLWAVSSILECPYVMRDASCSTVDLRWGRSLCPTS